MKTKQIVIVIGILVVVIGLLAIGRFTGTTATGMWKDTNIECLTQGHQNLSQHFHPQMRITENGEEVPLPANIGISGNCLAELHTHDSSGTIHVETVLPHTQFTLADFFTVWGESIERNGVLPIITVNGASVPTVEDVVLADGQQILLIYGEDVSASISIPEENSHQE